MPYRLLGNSAELVLELDGPCLDATYALQVCGSKSAKLLSFTNACEGSPP